MCWFLRSYSNFFAENSNNQQNLYYRESRFFRMYDGEIQLMRGSHGLSEGRSQAGPKGRSLEVGARRAPRARLLLSICQYHDHLITWYANKDHYVQGWRPCEKVRGRVRWKLVTLPTPSMKPMKRVRLKKFWSLNWHWVTFCPATYYPGHISNCLSDS